MTAAYLWGWDATPGAERWRKVLVNDEGKLIIDPTEIFENPPIEDEAGKAPTSEWAYDHWKDADAHHAQAHEDTHKSGGADEIDSPLGIAAMADLANTKIWQGNAANRPVEVAMPAAGVNATSGSYAGNDSQNRAIPHGLGVIPKFVFYITLATNYAFAQIHPADRQIMIGFKNTPVTTPTTTNFYVGDGAPGYEGNETGVTYYWIAMG